jgi:hypothetical protein
MDRVDIDSEFLITHSPRRLLRDHGPAAPSSRGTAEQGNGPPRDYSGVSFLSRWHLRRLRRLRRLVGPARYAMGMTGIKDPVNQGRVCRAAFGTTDLDKTMSRLVNPQTDADPIPHLPRLARFARPEIPQQMPSRISE